MLNQKINNALANSAEAAFRRAQVVSVVDNVFELDEQGFEFEAIAAFSCLVRPIAGDVVLYASTGGHANVIVSIVE